MWHFAGMDWTAWLAELNAWQPLSIFARRTVLDQLTPDLPIVTARLSGHLDVLKTHGWIPPITGGRPRRVPEARRPLLALLRAMDRARLFETTDHAAMVAYLRTHAEPDALAHGLGRPGTAVGVLAHLIEDDGGLPAFLDQVDATSWARSRWPRTDLPRILGDSGDEARTLVDWLVERRRPVTFAELRVADGPLKGDALGRALAATLPACLAFFALRSTDLEPVIGCWPPAVARVRRRRARVAPRLVEPALTGGSLTEGDHAGLIDLTNLMAACASDPPRLKAGHIELFKRARADLAERMTPLAPWLNSLLGTTPEQRVDDWVVTAHHLGLLKPRGTVGKDLRLTPTRAGQAWLTGNDATRLRSLLDTLREIRVAVARRDHDHPRHPFNGFFRYLPSSLEHGFVDEDTRTTHVIGAFEDLEIDRFFEVEAFLDHRAARDNPGPAVGHIRIGGHGRNRGMPEDELRERYWHVQLRRFLMDRLFRFGGARFGRTDEGHVAFTLTEGGRYLMGFTDTFQLTAGTDDARLVVQPSFEVVFLAPSPLAEGRLARIADRIGEGGVGVLFQITQSSAQRAAGAGLSSDGAIAILRDASGTPVPANVERQMREWIERCRRVTVADTVVIRCPDAETATRALGIGGGRLRLLSDTVLELVTSSQRGPLLRRLRDEGIFPDDGAPSAD